MGLLEPTWRHRVYSRRRNVWNNLAAERCCRSDSPPCHPFLQRHVLSWQWPLSGSPQSAGQTGTSQASPFHSSLHSQYTEPVEFLTLHSPRPEQLLGHVFTLRGRKQREEPGFRIQTLNKTSGTPYIDWVTSAFVSAAPQLSPGLEIKYATYPLQTAYGVVIGIVIPHRVVRRLPRHLSLISGGPLHWSSVELHAEVTDRHKVTTGTEEQMVNTGNLQ